MTFGRAFLFSDPCSCDSTSRLNMVGPTMTVTQQTVSTDEALQLIANQQRRKILQSLREAGETGIQLDELVLELTEEARPSNTPPSSQDTQIKVELIHRHLPKLENSDMVSFDRNTGMVNHGSAFDAVERVLTLLQRNAEELPTGYLPEEAA